MTLPSHVRVFWWLSVAIVAYWLILTGWDALFPSERYLAALRKLPPAHAEWVHRLGLYVKCSVVLFWSFVTLGPAWLAAFRRQNWARWAFALVFPLREFLLPLLMMAYLQLDMSSLGARVASGRMWAFFLGRWSHPLDYVIPALTIAAAAAVFSGNANDWFRKPAADAGAHSMAVRD